EALGRLGERTGLRRIDTTFGRTHATISGNPTGRPLIVIPGMSVSGPIAVDFFRLCGRSRLLIGLDLIGHPGRSEDRIHLPKAHAFGCWLSQVLDAFRIDQADIATTSFSASVALDLAAICPRRVGKLALVMPAGLVRLQYLKLALYFFLPWM